MLPTLSEVKSVGHAISIIFYRLFSLPWLYRAVWQLIPSSLALLWDSQLHALNTWPSFSADIPFSPGLSCFPSFPWCLHWLRQQSFESRPHFHSTWVIPQRLSSQVLLLVWMMTWKLLSYSPSDHSVTVLLAAWNVGSADKLPIFCSHNTVPLAGFSCDRLNSEDSFELVPWPARIFGFFPIRPVSGKESQQRNSPPYSRFEEKGALPIVSPLEKSHFSAYLEDTPHRVGPFLSVRVILTPAHS